MILKHLKLSDSKSEPYCQLPLLVTNGNDSPNMNAWNLSRGDILPIKTICERNFEIDSIDTFGSLLASIEYDPSKKDQDRDSFNVYIYDLSKVETS